MTQLGGNLPLANSPDVVESVGLGLGAPLAVALVLFLARTAREWWRYRRGSLSGYWLWLTYDPQDLSMHGDLWSIEIAELRHRHTTRADEITGSVWRVFDRAAVSHWTRSWTLTGWKLDEVVEGAYRWTRDPGGSHGVIHVWATDDGFEGKYSRVVKYAHGQSLTHHRVDAGTEWVRLPKQFSPVLVKAIARIPAAVAKKYPRRVRRKLGIRVPRWLRILEGMAYAVAPVDNYFALARASEALGSSDAKPEDDAAPMVIYRADLELGARSGAPDPPAAGVEPLPSVDVDDRKAA